MLGKNITNVLHEKRLRIYNNKQQIKRLFRIKKAGEFYLITTSIRTSVNVDLKKRFSLKV